MARWRQERREVEDETNCVADGLLQGPALTSSVPSPELASNRIKLRAVTSEDVGYLYQLATCSEAAFRSRFRGATPSPEEFTKSLWQGVLAHFMLQRTADGRRVGYALTHKADHRHGHAYLSLLIDPTTRPSLSFDASKLVLDYLFTVWDFRKIYCECLDFEAPMLGPRASGYLSEEGRLRDHEFYGGRYWDLVIYAVHRDQWAEWGTPRANVLPGPSAS